MPPAATKAEFAVSPSTDMRGGLFSVSSQTMQAQSAAPSAVIVPKEQSYFWTPAWQHEEAIAEAELSDGHFTEFKSSAAAAAWLVED